ncbi:hypothetical protein PA598K_00626 [Paenibacillus sp. 598K]|uniref:hypothetical protein n=1 Tax=Paenibacillus sp. 598K TaxID=1117987 RepID=UPI000FF96C24|nr:hypothetical protein [Paenibacillus sp. 598K]GBF72377.1 hypothetical protein PA598K_00626 [Paenibacillus sp. 598K]
MKTRKKWVTMLLTSIMSVGLVFGAAACGNAVDNTPNNGVTDPGTTNPPMDEPATPGTTDPLVP